MKMQNILKPSFSKLNKKVIAYLFTTILFAFVVFISSGKLLLAYSHSKEIEEQLIEMENELKDWRQKTDLLNQKEYRPIKKEQLEIVQSDIMLALQSHELELSGFKSVNSTNPSQQVFELSFKGTYENTLEYLDRFHFYNALIHIVNLRMNPDNGEIVTTIRYIIYVK